MTPRKRKAKPLARKRLRKPRELTRNAISDQELEALSGGCGTADKASEGK